MSFKEAHKTLAWWLSLCALALTSQARASDGGAPLRVYVHPLPPIVTVEAERVGGYLIETLDMLSKELGQSYRAEVVPFQRGMALVERPGAAAFATAIRMPERTTALKWVGPVLQTRVWFYKKSGSALNVKEVADAKHLRVVVVQGGAIHHELQRLGFARLTAVPRMSDAVRMINSGAVDLLPSGEHFIRAGLAERGLPPETLIQTAAMLQEWPLSIAFSPSTPDEVIRRWQDALDKLYKSGEQANLARKYFGADHRIR